MNEKLKDVSDNELIAEVLRRGNRLVMVEPTTWVWGIKQHPGFYQINYTGPAPLPRITFTDDEIRDHTVKWENGKSQSFPPYSGYGFSKFISEGFKNGRVWYNGEEIIEHPNRGWVIKGGQFDNAG